MNDTKFEEVKQWKNRVISYYKKYRRLDADMCAWEWASYKDMILAMQFMKHQINKNHFSSADFEDLIIS